MFVPYPRVEVGHPAPLYIINQKGNGLVLFFGVGESQSDDVGVVNGFFEVGEDGFDLLSQAELFFENGQCILEYFYLESLILLL